MPGPEPGLEPGLEPEPEPQEQVRGLEPPQEPEQEQASSLPPSFLAHQPQASPLRAWLAWYHLRNRLLQTQTQLQEPILTTSS